MKLLGKGDVGKVYLVLLKGTQKLYAMKVLTKEEMIARNKVCYLYLPVDDFVEAVFTKVKRVLTER
ncbi:hypothetical protein DNF23_56845, partial [Pseudomonas syringae pv. pisi]